VTAHQNSRGSLLRSITPLPRANVFPVNVDTTAPKRKMSPTVEKLTRECHQLGAIRHEIFIRVLRTTLPLLLVERQIARVTVVSRR
jgi:hypothetical protein